MAITARMIAHDGNGPLTEGYQPGQALIAQYGYSPTANTGNGSQSTAPKPPSGGSSAAKPATK